MLCLVEDREPESDVILAADTISVLYSGFSAQMEGREDVPQI